MRITVDRSTLEKLLHHAAFAAHLIGHLDDGARPELIRQLGDHVDTIAERFTERSERFILDGKGVRPTKNAT